MRRGKWFALIVLPVLLLAGDFFYWRLAVDQLAAEFEAWSARARASGWIVSHGAVVKGGWPNAAALRVKNLTVSAAGVLDRGGSNIAVSRFEWGCDALSLRSGLTRPEVLEITPTGLHPLRLNDSPPIQVSAEDLRVRMTLRPGMVAPRVVNVEAGALLVSIPGVGPVQVGSLNGRAGLNPGAGRDQPVVTFSASAQPVSLPERLRFGLGADISEVELEGVVNGPWPSGGRDLAERATVWRDGGGSLEIQRLALAWGSARLDATATLALDEDLQPMGAATSKIVGYDAALDALATNAVLSRSAVQAAKAVLSLLANTPADGQPEEVDVPLALQFRTLSVRQVPLARFPELDWNGH